MVNFSKGITIEVIKQNGYTTNRVCCHNGAMCRYTNDNDEAASFAKIFQEYT